jgi:hypothetical protein
MNSYMPNVSIGRIVEIFGAEGKCLEDLEGVGE